MTATSRLKGKSLSARVSEIQGEVTKPGPGHSKADQATHITQWLKGEKETGAGFPTSSGKSKEKHMAGKIPPQFLKHAGKKGTNPFAKDDEDPKAAAKKKKSGRAKAVAKRMSGKTDAKKGSMPPWLEKK